jgi:hypothetical protein
LTIAPVTTNGAVYNVALPSTNAAQFSRLRKP